MVMSVREIDRFLEQWEMDTRDLHRRMILAPTPRERERWHAVWLAGARLDGIVHCGGTGTGPAYHRAMGVAFGEGGPAALIFEQTGVPPRAGPTPAGGVERGSAATSCRLGAWNWLTGIGRWYGSLCRSGSASV